MYNNLINLFTNIITDMSKPSSKNDIINFYECKDVKKRSKQYNNPAFDQCQIKFPAMMACIGSTGSGKSMFCTNLIYQAPNTFSKVVLVIKMMEPLYEFLQEKLKTDLVIYKKLSELPPPDELVKDDPLGAVLLVFDDIVTAKNMDQICEYYMRGRKCGGGISCLFLSQSYYAIPKFIRLQLHYLILLKLSGVRDLNLILADNNLGIDKEELIKIFKDATNEKFNFLKLDLANGDINKKYSKNWTQFYQITE